MHKTIKFRRKFYLSRFVFYKRALRRNFLSQLLCSWSFWGKLRYWYENDRDERQTFLYKNRPRINPLEATMESGKKKEEGIIEPGIIAAYLNQVLPQNVRKRSPVSKLDYPSQDRWAGPFVPSRGCLHKYAEALSTREKECVYITRAYVKYI